MSRRADENSDLVVLIRLAIQSGPAPSYAALGEELGLTASEAHAAVERSVQAQLALKSADGKPSVIRAALRDFMVHGARYAFPATRGSLTRGIPTGYAAPPLIDTIQPGGDAVPVWPYERGEVRGISLVPLYPSVPAAAVRNHVLYEVLALFDAIRTGSARERRAAVQFLEQRLVA